jgi:hypothetical protein
MITGDFPESPLDTIKCFGHYRSSCYIRKLIYKPKIVHAVCWVNAVQGFPAKNHRHAPGPTGVSGRPLEEQSARLVDHPVFRGYSCTLLSTHRRMEPWYTPGVVLGRIFNIVFFHIKYITKYLVHDSHAYACRARQISEKSSTWHSRHVASAYYLEVTARADFLL